MQLTHQRLPRPADTTPDNFRTSAMAHPRTQRTDYVRSLSSTFGGELTPVFAVPLLREDQLGSTTFRFSLEMAETASMLMNAVKVRASVWLVAKPAMGRHMDLGQINRSYLGQPEADGTPIPWFVHHSHEEQPGQAWPFYQRMGLHLPTGVAANQDYVNAYNAVWNYLAEQASPALAHRELDDATIAPAFWDHSVGRHIKATFDQALMHGDVPIDTSAGRAIIKSSTVGNLTGGGYSPAQPGIPPGEAGEFTFDEVWAELGAASMSLANIDMARKTAAFARSRQAYQGLGDDEIIDLLMSGVRIPDEEYKYPQLLGEQSSIFGMSQRYATDSGNLEKSVTRGQTQLDVRVQTPPINPGGVVIGVLQVLPEQLFERQEDVYLTAQGVDDLPNRLEDELNLEQVEIVKNRHMDTDHSTPDGTFGYAPMNHHWVRDIPNIGGLYYRPKADQAWNEWRNRIWAVEQPDPQLGSDFYLASNIHHQVFANSSTEPFEVTANGMARISGLTAFGAAIRESYGDYDKMRDKTDTSRLDPPDPAQE